MMSPPAVLIAVGDDCETRVRPNHQNADGRLRTSGFRRCSNNQKSTGRTITAASSSANARRIHGVIP